MKKWLCYFGCILIREQKYIKLILRTFPIKSHLILNLLALIIILKCLCIVFKILEFNVNKKKTFQSVKKKMNNEIHALDFRQIKNNSKNHDQNYLTQVKFKLLLVISTYSHKH